MSGEYTLRLKTGLAEMLKGGVIMDVTNAEQAKIAEDNGAAAVMALERVPADIRREGGVVRMASIEKIREIMKTVSIPVMAKCRIGHFAEAQMLQALGVDYIDESEVLTPADELHHVDKFEFKTPFVCGCRSLPEALRRIGEGAAMIRSKGEAGTGDIVQAVRHLRETLGHIRRLTTMPREELMAEAKNMGAPYELVRDGGREGRASGAVLLCGRDRHPRRRLPGHAAGRAVGVRGKRHLQVHRAGQAGPGHRRGHHPLPGSRGAHPGEREPGRGHGRDQRLVDPGAGAPGNPGLVNVGKPIGVLALQGDFQLHAGMLERLGAPVREVRVPRDLEGVSGLILPGGESTTMLKLLESSGLGETVTGYAGAGGAVFGTCAGLILMARSVTRPEQASLGLLDVDVERNAYGRQVDSFETDIPWTEAAQPVRGVFIRAPRISRLGEGVRVLAEFGGASVLVRAERVLACSFHPELTEDVRLHRYFVEEVAGEPSTVPSSLPG